MSVSERGHQGLLVEILQSDYSHPATKTFGEDTSTGNEKCYDIKTAGSKLYAGCTTTSTGWSQDSNTDLMFWKIDSTSLTIDATIVLGIAGKDDDFGAMEVSSDESILYFSTVYPTDPGRCVVTVGKIALEDETI